MTLTVVAAAISRAGDPQVGGARGGVVGTPPLKGVLKK
jgi:hypothetical protein